MIDRERIKETYETCAPVHGVVGMIADNVGEVLRYLELTDKNGKTVEAHWLLDLIRRPNDRFSTRKFGQAWAINKLLYGDAWVYAKKAIGKDLGTIKEMYVMPSHKVEVEKLRALIFDQFKHGYYVTGEQVGKAWNAGKDLMK